LPAAQEHLERAIQLEPENQSYLVELAQVQMRRNEIEAALRTLAPLQQPNVDEKLRASAEEIRSEILRQTGGTH
jgi:thioredoxin-like negative regulator of GroEL